MGIVEVLTIIFVIAKILGLITWSWWIVFSPMLIVLCIYLLLIIAFFTTGFTIFKRSKF